MRISEIWIYPIKSCGGIQVQKAVVNPKGLEIDRRWMLINDNNEKISQREVEKMSHITVSFIDPRTMLAFDKQRGAGFLIPTTPPVSGDVVRAKIWDDVCDVVLMKNLYHRFFSKILGVSCRLVYIPEDSKRPTRKFDVGLADGYHSLMISQESVDFLNSKLKGIQVSTRNFRPNFVFSGEGAEPHCEDLWDGYMVMIGNAKFLGVKPCARCKVITIDPDTGVVNPKINKVLATYRRKKILKPGIYFGLNMAAMETGKTVRVGDYVKLLPNL